MSKSERNNALLKILDKFLGVPLVMILGLFRENQKVSLPIKKIALLKISGIGDTILLSGIISDIKNKWPNVTITFFVCNNNYSIAKMIKGVDKVIKLPLKNIIRARKAIKKEGGFDAWLDYGQWARVNAIYSYFAIAKYKVGFKTHKQYRHYIYDKTVMHKNDIHEVENFRNVTSSVNVVSKSCPIIEVDSGERESLPLDIGKNPVVVFHMFSAGKKAFLKEWPDSNWKELSLFVLNRGYTIVFTGSNNNTKRVDDVIKKIGTGDNIVNLSGRATLSQVALILSLSHLVVSIDTGIMHLASAVNAPLIALHGPTSPKRWGSINDSSISFHALDLPCCPCLSLGFENNCCENKCMKKIDVQQVINRAKKFLIQK
jgi:ADP-heptose:LPS heptosyltransferase